MDPRKPPLLVHLSPFARLLFTVLLIIACFSFTFLAGLLLAGPMFGIGMGDVMKAVYDYADPKTLALLKYLQVLQAFGLFIFPALLTGYLFERSSVRFLGLDRTSRWQVWIVALALMFIALPFINWMVDLNGMMKLPPFLKGIEEWMTNAEAEAAKLTDAFMQMPSFGAFMFNLVMIALLPAIGEEFLFRGTLQRLFRDWLGSIHAAIWLSAILFSALHMQFYGFLPRMMLGVLFGYLYWWTGSLWIPVFGHFINNGGAVVVEWLGQRGIVSGDYENFGATGNWMAIAGSILATGACLWFIWRFSKAKDHFSLLS